MARRDFQRRSRFTGPALAMICLHLLVIYVASFGSWELKPTYVVIASPCPVFKKSIDKPAPSARIASMTGNEQTKKGGESNPTPPALPRKDFRL